MYYIISCIIIAHTHLFTSLHSLQVAGGVLGLVFSVPDLIQNCEELIKNKHQTEASKFLRKKANEIYEAMKNLQEQLNKLQ